MAERKKTQKLPRLEFTQFENSQNSKKSKLRKLKIRRSQILLKSDFARVRFSPSQVYVHDESTLMVITPSIGGENFD